MNFALEERLSDSMHPKLTNAIQTTDGWIGPDSKATTNEAIQYAQSLIELSDQEPFAVAPRDDGGLWMEWRNHSRKWNQYQLDIEPDGQTSSWLYIARTGKNTSRYWEYTNPSLLVAVNELKVANGTATFEDWLAAKIAFDGAQSDEDIQTWRKEWTSNAD